MTLAFVESFCFEHKLTDNVVTTIKAVRTATGCSLRDGKEFVDDLDKHHRTVRLTHTQAFAINAALRDANRKKVLEELSRDEVPQLIPVRSSSVDYTKVF